MAITKILYMKDCGSNYSGRHLKQSIDYITVPEKTGGGRFVSAVNCQPGYAYEQMRETKKLFYKTDKRQGYHIIISFEEGEVTAELAFQIVGEFVEEYLGKEYEAVYAIHDNTAHIHGHIIFNSVSFLTGKKYRYEKGDWARYIQPITNRLCDKYGLSTITIEDDRAVEHDTYTEWCDRKDGKFVWSDMIKRDLDACVLQADDFGEFLKLLMDKGYEVKQNKYLAVKPPGMGRYRRCKYFGTDYTEERLRERILTEDMEYYREHHGGAKIIKVNVPYRIRRAKLTGIQRKYFARLYRIGRLKQRPYSQAWKYRDEIRKMHRLHEQYMFLSDHEIHSLADLERVYGQMSEKKKLLSCERSRFYKERGRYKSLWDKADRIKLLFHAESAFQNGDGFFADEHEEYEKLKAEVSAEGYSLTELEKLREHYREKAVQIKEEYALVSRDYRIVDRIMKEQSENTDAIKQRNNRDREQVKEQSR